MKVELALPLADHQRVLRIENHNLLLCDAKNILLLLKGGLGRAPDLFAHGLALNYLKAEPFLLSVQETLDVLVSIDPAVIHHGHHH